MARTQLRKFLFCSLLFISIFEGVQSVDRNKFKRCDQSSFCTRNRALGDSTDVPLYNVSDVKKVSNSHISALIISPYTQKLLNLHIYTVQDNVIRLKITEDDGRRYPGPQDLLLPLKEVPFREIQNSQTQYVFSTASNNRVELTLSPFKLDFFVDEQPVITANQRNLFNFEHLRSKEEDSMETQIRDPNAVKPDTWQDETDGVWEAPLIDNPKAAGRWDERFESHQDSKPRGPTAVAMDFTFHDTQHVYGIPEHASSLALKTTKGRSDPYRLYNLDVFEYELNNEMALYGAIPFMLAHNPKRTVGLFWFNSAETWIDIVHGNTGLIMGNHYVNTHWISESGNIDVFFFLGPKPYDVFGRYAEVTGNAPIPPMFSIAYHQCKWNYKDQKEVAEVDFGFDSWNIPMDVIWLDIEHTDGKAYFTWDKNHFQTPKDMQASVAAKGRKMVTIVDPHIKRDGNYHIHKDAQADGDLYIKNRDGNEYEGHCWPGSSSWIDYTSSKARKWWSDKFSYDTYQGSTPNLFTWNDMNEPSVFNGPEVTMHKDAIHYGGVEHRDVHNAYGFYMHLATAEGLTSRNKDRNERPFVLSRAFFAGTQRAGAIWTGDNKASWDHLEIAQPMLLSLGIAGLSFVGADVGGFFGNPEPELLTRWYQAGAFYPFFRAHAHLDSKRREPWLMPPEHVEVISEAIRTRYTFLPFWYTLYHNNSISGIPIMRPLWVEYPEDTSIFSEEQTFLVGRDLLVRPVVSAGTTSASVYLPGKEPWYDFVANAQYAGGQSYTIQTPLKKICVFQRGGSIIPKKERLRRSSTLMVKDPYTLVIALDSKHEAEGDLYTDDEHSFNHQKGEYTWRRFEFKNLQLTSMKMSDGTYAIDNTVERIVIFGLPKVSKIVMNGNELEFSVDGIKTTIRKPNVRIVDDWKITFQ